MRRFARSERMIPQDAAKPVLANRTYWVVTDLDARRSLHMGQTFEGSLARNPKYWY